LEHKYGIHKTVYSLGDGEVAEIPRMLHWSRFILPMVTSAVGLHSLQWRKKAVNITLDGSRWVLPSLTLCRLSVGPEKRFIAQ
jgi:hypothetical protein